MSEGRNLRAGWVPMTTFWLLDATDNAVGVSRLRHRLTESLMRSGGHIGYFVKRQERGKGYGTAILHETLDEARKLGIEEPSSRSMLTTCRPFASSKPTAASCKTRHLR
jgi:predicted acetyltransferase